jgi:CheY-like chemotaxis protein
VVEDEFFLADDLKKALGSRGAEIVGPIGHAEEALEQVGRDGIDVAVIDVNLHGQATYEIADRLLRDGIPFIFATGYATHAIGSAT